ncbi:P21-Rho-binding domain-containing protein, partial [Neocallimastix sp. 'constans']
MSDNTSPPNQFLDSQNNENSENSENSENNENSENSENNENSENKGNNVEKTLPTSSSILIGEKREIVEDKMEERDFIENIKERKRPESFSATSAYESSKSKTPRIPERNSLTAISPHNVEKKNKNSFKVAFASLKNSFSEIFSPSFNSTSSHEKKGSDKKNDKKSSNKKRDISIPYNALHVVHVGYDSKTGIFSGLPREWQVMLSQAGISKQDQEAHPDEVIKVINFYNDSTKLDRNEEIWDKFKNAQVDKHSKKSGKKNSIDKRSSCQSGHSSIFSLEHRNSRKFSKSKEENNDIKENKNKDENIKSNGTSSPPPKKEYETFYDKSFDLTVD